MIDTEFYRKSIYRVLKISLLKSKKNSFAPPDERVNKYFPICNRKYKDTLTLRHNFNQNELNSTDKYFMSIFDCPYNF